MQGITVNTIVDFGSEYDGRNRKRAKDKEKDREDKGRLPRITRLMALAIYLQEMLDKGDIKDQAEIARLGHVTRARVTQIMNLKFLAPDIQEDIRFLPNTVKGRDPIPEGKLRLIVKELCWNRQRTLWKELKSRI